MFCINKSLMAVLLTYSNEVAFILSPINSTKSANATQMYSLVITALFNC